MTKHEKYVPKHRTPPTPAKVAQVPRIALRSTLILSTLAVGGTGAAVAGGVVAGPGSIAGAESVAPQALTTVLAAPAAVSERPEVISRSADRRAVADPAKEAALSQDEGSAMARTESLSESDPRDIGQALLAEFGFSSDQFGCLDSLWTRESGWNTYADNPSSSAYGIPQALPGSKMSSAGADWATNPVTQIRWGLGYIQDRYGSPCGAWSHSESYGWY